MPKKYPQDVRLRAVALAQVRSIPIAARDLGVPVDTLTRWVDEEPPTPALELAVNLALSQLTARIADGTIKGRDLTVAYGVLRDKLARYGKAAKVDAASIEQRLLIIRNTFLGWPVEGDPAEADAFWDAFHDWMQDAVPEAHWPIACRLVFSPLSLEWQRRRNYQHEPLNADLWDATLPAAIDGAGSDLPKALLTWATQRVLSYGDLGDWKAAQDAAEQQRRLDLAEKGRQTALAYQQRALDAETQRVIADAVAWLAAQSIEVDARDRLDSLLPEP